MAVPRGITTALINHTLVYYDGNKYYPQIQVIDDSTGSKFNPDIATNAHSLSSTVIQFIITVTLQFSIKQPAYTLVTRVHLMMRVLCQFNVI